MAKEINELNLPEDVLYTDDHEWAKAQGDNFRAGVSDYAQEQLGEIVFVELPEPGSEFEKGSEFGTLESVKAVAELYMPISGEIISVNTELEDAPEQVNSDPYGKGWMVEIKPSNPEETNELKNKEEYLDMLKGC